VEGSQEANTIILLHGYGANKEDLFPLHEYIQTPANTRWIFPDAPLEMEGYFGRAWFPILASNIEQIQAGLDFSKINPKGLSEATEKVIELVNSLNTPKEKIILGGFSQGAMLSTQAMLSLNESINSLLILSGTLVNSDNWEKSLSEKSKFHFFQSHGIYDPILPYANAEKLFKLLKKANHEGELIHFNGGHEIPDLVLKKLNQFLETRL
jgi:phospholipase/carboxylesterase